MTSRQPAGQLQRVSSQFRRQGLGFGVLACKSHRLSCAAATCAHATCDKASSPTRQRHPQMNPPHRQLRDGAGILRRRDHTEEESPGPWRKAVWDKEPPCGAWDCFGVLRAPREAASHRFLEDGLSRETSMSIASAGLGSEKKRESRNDQLDENAPQQCAPRPRFPISDILGGPGGGAQGRAY